MGKVRKVKWVPNARKLLWRIYTLLGNDRETNNETTAVDRQRSARQWTGWKAVRANGFARNNGYNNEELCFLRGPCRGVIRGTKFRAYFN
jgi:hypothetical protein